MRLAPTDLTLVSEDVLQIRWSDEQVRQYRVRQLREACPCASCREKRTTQLVDAGPLLPVLRPEETQPLRIQGMEPVGSYAYSIQFSDGHNTGIYTLEFLRELGEAVTES